MIAVVRLNGDDVFKEKDLELSELTTVGALAHRASWALCCERVDIVFKGNILSPSHLLSDFVRAGEVVHAVVRDKPPHASTDFAFSFLLKDGFGVALEEDIVVRGEHVD